MKPSRCDCSIIIPTRNRCGLLSETLGRLDELPDGGFEVIVVDNGSEDRTLELARRYPRVRWIALGENLGAAGRNVAAAAAEGWLLLMLDDDSWPAPGVIDQLVSLFGERLDLGAAGLRVKLADPPHAHDAGGVAGIFFNCGGAVRRRAFLEAGGFPIDYGYYAEEYDLCCRLWQRGWVIEPRGDLFVWHRRTKVNRDNDNMVRLLVRNNLRLWRRYAPPERRDELIAATIDRCRLIALKEDAMAGFEAGLREGGVPEPPALEPVLAPVRRRPLSVAQFERLMGLDRARERLRRWADKHRIRTAALWSRGKGCEFLLDAAASLHIGISAVYDRPVEAPRWRGIALRDEAAFDPSSTHGIIIGSLSCGVAEDLLESIQGRYPGLPIVSPAPWTEDPTPACAVRA